MSSRSSPPTKRVKLEELSPTAKVSGLGSKIKLEETVGIPDDELEESDDNCSICLHSVVDRTVVPKCSHEFCFECLLVWTEQSRRCPLCSQLIGEYLIHSIRSRYDYRKHFLTPLRTSPAPVVSSQRNERLIDARRNARRRQREREWGRRDGDEREAADKLEISIMKRRWIYQHDLYAKHVASNSYTKYRPYPTPPQFSSSPDLISRTTTFLRRELQVWEGLDVEFLTTLIISLMKSIDIRSESAVKLLSEFLDMDAPYVPGGRHVNAEHFAHEVYCYVRSPYRDLFVYDTIVQYDASTGIPAPPEIRRTRRWRQSHRSPSPSPTRQMIQSVSPGRETQDRTRSKSRTRDRSPSWSPSGRRYPSSTDAHNELSAKSPASRNRSPSDPRQRRIHHSQRAGERISVVDSPSSGEKAITQVERHKISASERTPTPLIPDNDTRSCGTGNGKGKRRADDGDISLPSNPRLGTTEKSSEPRSESLASTHEIRESNQSKVQDCGSRVGRTPRNRNLRESVQAHLAGTIGRGQFLSSKVSRTRETLGQSRQPLIPTLTDSSNLNQEPDGHACFRENDVGYSKIRLGSDSNFIRPTHKSNTIHCLTIASSSSVPGIHTWETASQPPSPLSNPLQESSRLAEIINQRTNSHAPPPPFDEVPLKLDATLQNFTDVSSQSPTPLNSQLRHPSPSSLPTHQIPKSVDTHVCSTPCALIENNLVERLAQPEPTSASHSSHSRLALSTDSLAERSKLLARLDNEKLEALSASKLRGLDSKGISCPPPNVDIVSKTAASSSKAATRQSDYHHDNVQEVLDSETDIMAPESSAKEAALRLRARLHARLITERRKGGYLNS